MYKFVSLQIFCQKLLSMRAFLPNDEKREGEIIALPLILEPSIYLVK